MWFLLFHSRNFWQSVYYDFLQKVKNMLVALVKDKNLLNLEQGICSTLGLANFRCIKWKGVSTLVAGQKHCWSSLFLWDGVYIYAYIYIPDLWKQRRDFSVLPRSVRWPWTVSIAALSYTKLQLSTSYYISRLMRRPW